MVDQEAAVRIGWKVRSWSFTKKVYKGFCVLQEKYPWRVRKIDASKDVNTVFKQVLEQIECLLRCKK